MSAIPPLRSGQAVTPPPDAGRVAAIRNSLDVNDPADLAAFGDRARREVTASVERLLAEVRTNDLREAADVIGQAREILADLDPVQLEPRRGLAGLFDSRGRRLRRFREMFRKSELLIEGFLADLGERGDSLQRRSRALDSLHEQTRAFILELDAYLEAGWSRLPDAPGPAAEAAPPEPAAELHPEPQRELADAAAGPAPSALEAGVSEVEATDAAAAPAPEPPEPPQSGPSEAETTGEDAEPRPEPPPLMSARERLEARLRAMAAVRTVALRQLALVRMAQNADLPAVGRLAAARAALVEWRAGWTEGLGLTTRRPRRIRPDVVWLAAERETADAALAASERVLAATRARRAEAAERMERVAEAIRRA